MRGAVILGLILVMMPLVIAEEVEDYNDFAMLEIETKIESSAYSTGGNSPRVDEMKLNLSFFPRTEQGRQIVEEEKTWSDPATEPIKGPDSIAFVWMDPTGTQYKYSVESKVKTLNTFQKIKKKAEFPPDKFSREVRPYLEPTEFIDFNDDIRNKATEIIGGETDYFRVMYKLGAWVEENIEYNLDTINTDAVQKSSWVLKNRQGVCDELTNLYISFLRSAGIPARFVGGQVYTNIDHDFGNHGWAEVFYPGVGWIPVDVTFGQIGWVDPSHVKFQHTLDSGDPSATIFYKTLDMDFRMNNLLINTEVKKTVGKAKRHVGLLAEPLKKAVGPGSYVPVMITVINPNDYYVPLTLHLTKAPDIEGKNRKILLLAPLEEKEVFWIVKVSDKAEDKYTYTTIVEAETVFGTKTETKIKYEKGLEVYSKEWAEKQVKELSPVSDKEFFPDVSLECRTDKPYYYQSETAKVQCEISNKGNVMLSNVKVCYQNDCQSIDLTIGEKKTMAREVPMGGFKDERLIVTAESKNMVRKAYTNIEIINEPDIDIEKFKPKTIPYGKDAQFSFLLKTKAPAKNIRLEIADFGYSSLNRMEEKYEMLMPFNSKEFIRGKVDVILTYEDIVGKKYEKEFKYSIDVTDKPWYTRFLLWLEGHLN